MTHALNPQPSTFNQFSDPEPEFDDWELRILRCARCSHTWWGAWSASCALRYRFSDRLACQKCGSRLGTLPVALPTFSVTDRSFTCHVCHVTSYHAHDVAERYCIACHLFHVLKMPLPPQPSTLNPQPIPLWPDI